MINDDARPFFRDACEIETNIYAEELPLYAKEESNVEC